MKLKFILSSLFFCFCVSLYAQQPVFKTTMQKSRPFLFMENKGQLIDENRKALKDISFYGRQGGVNVYLRPGMISFVFTRVENATKQKSDADTNLVETHCNASLQRWHHSNDSSKISTSRMDLVFQNANTDPFILPTEQQEYYENYYTSGDANHGITNVRSYKTITCKSIYPDIDLVLKADPEKGMEYSFIVNPGGDVKDIKMQWKGVDSLNMSENFNSIRYSNSLGYIRESGLKAYVGDLKQAVSSRYITFPENGIGFDIQGYDHDKTLIIDPFLDWASYFGGENEEYGNCVATDLKNHVFIGGVAYSYSGIATSGAYVTSMQPYSQQSGAIWDAFIAKFDSKGSVLWSTYFGEKYNSASALTTDTSGNIYVTGIAKIGTGIATKGAYQTKYAGGNGQQDGDAYLAKFTATGSLDWATYFGGDGTDEPGSVCLDKTGNVFICGYTNSYKGIASSAAFKTSYSNCGNASGYNGYLAKFTNSGAFKWATYYGKCGTSANGVGTDSYGNVYITGQLFDSSGIATSGAYQTSYGGKGAAYLAKFSTTGTRIWSTLFGDGYSSVTGLSINRFDEVFITGSTSENGYGSKNGYQSSPNGGIDAFLAKFTSSGSLKWATYFGGNAEDRALAASTDLAGNVYITGQTFSTSGIATSGAFQTFNDGGPKNGGNCDAFIAKFNGSGYPTWATYFGGANMDIGNGISADTGGVVYVTGTTYSTDNIGTSGIHQTKNAGYQDAFLVKFHPITTDAGILSVIKPKGAFCAGKHSLSVQLKNFGSVNLNNVIINVSINRIVQSVYKWSGQLNADSSTIISIGDYSIPAGQDTVKIWTSSPNGFVDSFPKNDSAKIIYIVFALPVPHAGGNHAICLGSKINLGAIPQKGHSYTWTSTPGGFSSTVGNPSDTPASSTTYYLKDSINNNGCTNTDSAVITVNPVPDANTGGNHFICKGSGAIINLGTGSVKGDAFAWSSKPPGFSSNSSKPFVKTDTTTVYYLTETIIATGCTKTDSAVVKVLPFPGFDAGGNRTVCENDSIAIGKPSKEGYSYAWKSKPPGFSSTLANPVLSPKLTMTYYLAESVTGGGCQNTDSAVITVNPAPEAKTGASKTFCGGDSANLTLGTIPTVGNTYLWTSKPGGFSSANSNPNANPTGTTVYYLTETISATGCSRSDSLVVLFNPLPMANMGKYHAVCLGYGLTLGTNPITGHSYSWTSNPQGFTSTISNPGVNPSGQTVYHLTERIDATGCTKSDSIVIKINPLPQPKAGISHINCAGEKVNFGYGGTSGDNYKWSSSPGGYSSTLSSTADSPVVTTRYILEESDPVTGCSSKDSTLVFVNPLPTPDILGPDMLCANDAPVIFHVDTVSGSKYSWTVKKGIIIAGQGAGSVSVKFASEADTIIVTETNSMGCKGISAKNIAIRPNPDARFSAVKDSPDYKFTAIDSSEPFYKWDLGDSTAGSFYKITHHFPFTRDSLIKVSLTVAASSGCSSTYDSFINIHYFHPPVFHIRVFPNPFVNTTHIEIELDKAAHIHIVVYDAIGRLITSLADVQQSIGKQTYNLDGDHYNLSPAIYFLRILVDDKAYVRAVVRQ